MRISKQDNIYILSFKGIDIFFDDYSFDADISFVLLHLNHIVVSILEDDYVEELRNLINSINF